MQIIDDDLHYMDWYWVEPNTDNGTPGNYNYGEERYSKPTIVDLLEDQNLRGKAYAESLLEEYLDELNYDMPLSPKDNLKNVSSDHGLFPFARKHVPFIHSQA